MVTQEIDLAVADVAEFGELEFPQPENSTDSLQLAATAPDGSELSYIFQPRGDDDSALISFDNQTGQFSLLTPADFENPLDGNPNDGSRNNVYTFTVEATSDLTGVPVEQQINLRVTDVAEFDELEFTQPENSTEPHQLNVSVSVSYTHLTLPTTPYV